MLYIYPKGSINKFETLDLFSSWYQSHLNLGYCSARSTVDRRHCSARSYCRQRYCSDVRVVGLAAGTVATRSTVAP
jgi:hypothetical protein